MIIIVKNSSTQLTATSEGNIIDISSIEKKKTIKKVDDNSNIFDNISIVDANNTGSIKVKLAKSKNLV